MRRYQRNPENPFIARGIPLLHALLPHGPDPEPLVRALASGSDSSVLAGLVYSLERGDPAQIQGILKRQERWITKNHPEVLFILEEAIQALPTQHPQFIKPARRGPHQPPPPFHIDDLIATSRALRKLSRENIGWVVDALWRARQVQLLSEFEAVIRQGHPIPSDPTIRRVSAWLRENQPAFSPMWRETMSILASYAAETTEPPAARGKRGAVIVTNNPGRYFDGTPGMWWRVQFGDKYEDYAHQTLFQAEGSDQIYWVGLRSPRLYGENLKLAVSAGLPVDALEKRVIHPGRDS